MLEDYSLKAISPHHHGGDKAGRTACYCKENSFFIRYQCPFIDKDEVVLLDMSAGIEHLTRGTAGGVDLLLVVTS